MSPSLQETQPEEAVAAMAPARPTFLTEGTTEFGVEAPAGIFALLWTLDTRFFLVKRGAEQSRVEVDGLATSQGQDDEICAAYVTDQGHFAIAVRQKTGHAFFVAGPDGISSLRGHGEATVASLGLSPSGSWLALQCAAGSSDGAEKLQLFNTPKQQLLWSLLPWTGTGQVEYKFDEINGTLTLVYPDQREYSYRLADGYCLDRARYRMDLLVRGTAVQLVRLAHQEFTSGNQGLGLDETTRKQLGIHVFQILTVAAQRAPEWAPAYTALGEFFEWLPDITKARRCHARAAELEPTAANLENLARLAESV